jgi:hypothetical protein
LIDSGAVVVVMLALQGYYTRYTKIWVITEAIGVLVVFITLSWPPVA